MLTIVPTPIGNLKDITIRAIETLKNADSIICEDTRRTSLLLNHLNIKKPLIIFNDFNEPKMIDSLIEKLSSGQNLALVSDAGTPLISDPGYKLIRTCLEKNISVDSLPGAVSPIVALTLSGLPPDKFIFLGFLPDKTSKRAELFQKIHRINEILSLTYILFVSPFKVVRFLEEAKENLGDIRITLARELTKIHQEVKTRSAEEWLEEYQQRKPKGEFIALLNLN